MKTIREIEDRSGNYYEVKLNEVVIRKVQVTVVQRNIEGYTYYLPFTSYGRLIEEAFNFLNIEYMNISEGRRTYMASAIKCLYTYLELFNKDILDLDRIAIKMLSSFILGESIRGMHEEYLYITSRGNGTHNLYFDCIRKYFKYLKIYNEVLFEKLDKITVEVSNSFFDNSTVIEVSKFAINKKSGDAYQTNIPKYISLDEYLSIIKYNADINKSNIERNKIIIDLMYKYGMRLGEVLGITIEDIKKKNGLNTGATIIVRNRLSDKRWQNAKTCLKVKSTQMYNSKVYNKQFCGYEQIQISNQMYEEINKYLNSSRSALDISDKIFDNINKFALADSVEGNSKNYYVFLNKNGTPLASTGWNKYLRSAFRSVNIAVDSEIRKNNLSHRFRHGFAMYLIDVEKKPIEYVKDAMRHRSIRSTLIYYNPKETERLRRAEMMEQKINTILTGRETND